MDTLAAVAAAASAISDAATWATPGRLNARRIAAPVVTDGGPSARVDKKLINSSGSGAACA